MQSSVAVVCSVRDSGDQSRIAFCVAAMDWKWIQQIRLKMKQLDTVLSTQLLGIRFRWPFLESDCTTIFYKLLSPKFLIWSHLINSEISWGSILHLLVFLVSGIEICCYPRRQDGCGKLRNIECKDISMSVGCRSLSSWFDIIRNLK